MLVRKDTFLDHFSNVMFAIYKKTIGLRVLISHISKVHGVLEKLGLPTMRRVVRDTGGYDR